MTPMQRSIVDQLQREYGLADRILENGDSIYIQSGTIIRLDWWKQERSLSILPNGVRLNWRHVRG